MEELLNKFNINNWRSCCLEIELKLKKELQDGGWLKNIDKNLKRKDNKN